MHATERNIYMYIVRFLVIIDVFILNAYFMLTVFLICLDTYCSNRFNDKTKHLKNSIKQYNTIQILY